MALLPSFQSNDRIFQMLQTKWSAILNPIIGNMPQTSSLPTDDSLYVLNINSKGAMDTYTPTELATEVASTMQANSQWVLPAGMVAPYAGSNAPIGWLLCDGAAISRTTYSALFKAIGTTYGAGDGSTTFNVPDTRGIFISGVGSQTITVGPDTVTYNRTIGTKQLDQFQGHYHSANAITGSVEWTDASGSLGVWTNATGALSAQSPAYARPVRGSIAGSLNGVLTLNVTPTITAATTDGTNGTPRKGSETRPANIAMNYIIKV